MKPAEITAGRLHLRPFQDSDVPDLVRICSDPEIPRWTPLPERYTEQDAVTWVSETAPQMWTAGTGTPFAVCDSTTGALLAHVGLYRVAGRAAEIGFWCGADARGRGVTSDAVGVACRWGFEALDLERIGWVAGVGNWPSRRIAERNGFTFEGTLRKGTAQRDVRVDCWVAGRLREDPEVDTRRLPPYAPITDGVVTLRPWRDEDAADVMRACDDPLTVRFLPVPSPYTIEDGELFVGTLVPTMWADGDQADVAVADASTGELLGAVGLKLELANKVAEVGFWTAPWARGRGVAGRAAALHAKWGLDALALNRVELLADVENVASQRAAEKGGFAREGVLRRSRPDRTGEARDMVLFAITR
jgi:RimJ/RimL family protein N-acetyltransferase